MTTPRRAHLELPHRGPRPAGQNAPACRCKGVPILDRDDVLRAWVCTKCGRRHDPRRKDAA